MGVILTTCKSWDDPPSSLRLPSVWGFLTSSPWVLICFHKEDGTVLQSLFLISRYPVIFNQSILSGQIIATSHDLTPNGGLVREISLFQGNLGW